MKPRKGEIDAFWGWERLYPSHKGRKGWREQRDNNETPGAIGLPHKLPRENVNKATAEETEILLIPPFSCADANFPYSTAKTLAMKS